MPVTSEEVHDVISGLDKNKACGMDGITVESVQKLKSESSKIIAKIIHFLDFIILYWKSIRHSNRFLYLHTTLSNQ